MLRDTYAIAFLLLLGCGSSPVNQQNTSKISRVPKVAQAQLVQRQARLHAVPTLQGYVNDTAAMLHVDEQAKLEGQLSAYFDNNGLQWAFISIDGLGDESIESYARRVANSWALGDKDRDDGLLILLSKYDRQARIEVGLGINNVITDEHAARVMDTILIPSLKAAKPYEGLSHSFSALRQILITHQL